MNDDLTLGEFGTGTLHKFKKMLLMGVDALVLEEAEEMKLRIVLLPVLDEITPLLVLKEIAGGEPVVNALQFLNDDAPGTHIKVPDFGRTLVAVGKTYSLAAAVEKTMGITGTDLIDNGRFGAIDAIAVLALVNTPAVTDDEYYRSHFYLSP
jgi:hypothetical protein